MKKYILLSVVCLGFSTVASAQNQFVATLQHGDAVTNYYGTDALKKAHDAAETGDVITLSAGSFTGCQIDKGVTVRGVGMNSELKTEINGDIYIYSRDASWTTEFEGVRLNGTAYCQTDDNYSSAGKISFDKCYIYYFYLGAWSSSESNVPVVMLNNDVVYMLSVGGASKFSANNSVICCDNVNWVIGTSHSDNSNPSFYNCIICGRLDGLADACLNNCITYNSYDYFIGQLPYSCVASNCLGINPNALNAFEGIPSGASINNYIETDITSIFKSFKGQLDGFDELFELTTKGKGYKGTDGTEVGVQGGLLPYTLQVKYPVITKFQADSRTSNEGLLNVSIEVTNGK